MGCGMPSIPEVYNSKGQEPPGRPPRPERPIEPPRDANGQIDFDAWEARLRANGLDIQI